MAGNPIGRKSIFALALMVAAYAWSWRCVAEVKCQKTAHDYYGFLTDALVSGQLYLKIAPDPRLATLENPWNSYQGIPRLHDATYFHGRYYLYFGVTPVLILLGPWRLLTHTFLTEGAASVVFGFVGFLAGLDLLRRLVSKLPRPPPPLWIAAGVLVWGIGTFTFDLIQLPTFYIVPIMAAHACIFCALNALARAMDAERPLQAAGWLAAASLAWGLAVGARPHYVFGLPVLGLPLALILLRDGGTWAKGGRTRLLLATVLPAAAVGAFLAWYNFARFGTPFEFGFRYQFTGGDQRFINMWNPSMILPNLNAYLFHDGLYSLYFPFVIPTTEIIGMVPTLPLVALALVYPLTLLDRRMREDRLWLAVGTCAFAAGTIHLFCLSILPIGTFRYLVDYAPPFMLVALAAGAYLLGRNYDLGRLSGWVLAPVIGVLGAATLAHAGFLALQYSQDVKTKHTAAVILDRPIAALERAAGLGMGSVRLELSLDELKIGERAPLVETGAGADYIYIQRVDALNVRFAFVHRGDPEILGQPLAFEQGIRHTIVADLGSFYPPDEHPALQDLSEPMRDSLHRRVKVTLDGQTALSGASAFYASDSLHTYIGKDHGGGLAARYPGTIFGVSRGGVPSADAIENSGWTGPVRLHLRFPPFSYFISEPLVSTGNREGGDMVYVSYVGPGRLRFGHDSTDGGAVETRDVSFDPNAEHTLDIDMSQLRTPPNTAPDVHKSLQLRFDGKWLICADRAMHATKPFEVVFGYNSLVTGTAKDSYSGSLLRPEHTAPLPPPEEPAAGIGPLEIVVRFPPPIPGVNEPLAVTGRNGAGDFVYVAYLANNRIRIGIDHWAIGGALGDPIEIVPQQRHTITITSAALFPPESDPYWAALTADERASIRSTIRVEMDGQTVVEAPYCAYPSKPDEITVGSNRIGGSTCGAFFTGEIVSVSRLGLNPASAPTKPPSEPSR